MMNVLITVDTEAYPINPGWQQDHLVTDIRRDLYGEVDGHSVGLTYQLETLSGNNLKANFMLESLFAAVPEVGPEPLRTMVRAILSRGHDIQLHPHAEWIKFVPHMNLPYRSHLLRAYPVDEQEAIIRFARALLEDAGAPPPVAFRAGGFAANADTLVALSRCGIQYDSSFNRTYQQEGFQLPSAPSLGHMTEYNGVRELPISAFKDFFSHFRPAQLCACSFAEMANALERAESEGWNFFVIVSHSFEMLARRRHPRKPPIIRWEVVDRFERLCAFLAANRDRFPTVKFSELGHPSVSAAALDPPPATHIQGKLRNTAVRIFEQAVSRIQTR